MSSTRHSILGIDIGKDDLYVGFLPEVPEVSAAKNWRSVVQVSYQDPLWWRTLLDLIDEQAVVAAEPTGHHLLAPVANLIHTYKPAAQVWQVDHRLAEHYRASHVSAAKNDRLDAIALTLIARDIAAGQPPRSVRPYDYFLESAVERLRMLVNQHVTLTKENTRTKNRLDVLAHSLWPSFAGSATWARAVRHGAVTPKQIKALAAAEPPIGDYLDGRARSPLRRLAASLPEIDANPSVVAAIHSELDRQHSTDLHLASVADQIQTAVSLPPFRTVTQRWRTLPAASSLYLAALHVATLGRATELTKDEFRAALGVSPRTSISGSGDHTKATRGGYQPCRAFLYTWAMFLVSPKAGENPINAYYQAVEARPFAAAKNKLARVLWGTARNQKLDGAADEAGEFPPADS